MAIRALSFPLELKKMAFLHIRCNGNTDILLSFGIREWIFFSLGAMVVLAFSFLLELESGFSSF
jgi:hypothetical protein